MQDPHTTVAAFPIAHRLTAITIYARLDRLGKLDNEGVAAELLPIRGIGPWSVDMFLMFVLARPDVLPVGDLGIQNALARMHRLRKRPKPERMLTLTHAWKPYRSIGSWYRWRGLDTDLL